MLSHYQSNFDLFTIFFFSLTPAFTSNWRAICCRPSCLSSSSLSPNSGGASSSTITYPLCCRKCNLSRKIFVLFSKFLFKTKNIVRWNFKEYTKNDYLLLFLLTIYMYNDCFKRIFCLFLGRNFCKNLLLGFRCILSISIYLLKCFSPIFERF